MRNNRKDGKVPCMVVTEKQYLEDLQKPLINMGMRFYKMDGWDTFPLLVINASGILGKITNLPIESSGERNRFLIEPYNAELFLKEVRECAYGGEVDLKDIPKITEADLIGDLKGFPIEVVQKMVEERVKQGEKGDVTVFQKKANGGFFWDRTFNGFDFWSRVIGCEDFDLFFKEYPKEKIEQKAETKESNSEYPKMMQVSNDGINWYNRIVISKSFDLYFAFFDKYTLEQVETMDKSVLERQIEIDIWNFVKEIPEKVVITKQQIAEKFGIDVEDLIIK